MNVLEMIRELSEVRDKTKKVCFEQDFLDKEEITDIDEIDGVICLRK